MPLPAFTGDISTLASVENALRIRAAYSVYSSVNLGVVRDKAKYTSRQLFNEQYQQDMITFGTHHLVYYTVWSARLHLDKNPVKCPNLKKHLENLIAIYGLTELSKDSMHLFECGYFVKG